MKKIFYYNILFMFLIVIMASCKKQGPDGPEGPEGPPGNPGGSGGGSVLAFTTQGDDLEFKWKHSGFIRGLYELGRRGGNVSSYDYSYYIPDPDGVIPDGVVLVYVEMEKVTGGTGPVWISLPYINGNMAAGAESYETHVWYDDDKTGNNDMGVVSITAEIAQPSPTVLTPPSYKASGVKVIVIPAGITGILGGRYANTKDITLQEVMEKYHLKETDFKTIK